MYCATCGNYATCVCELKKKHKRTCRYLRAAMLGIEIECEHGFQACPKCDPCDCGAGATEGIL